MRHIRRARMALCLVPRPFSNPRDQKIIDVLDAIIDYLERSEVQEEDEDQLHKDCMIAVEGDHGQG